jgi:hypothetical protein
MQAVDVTWSNGLLGLQLQILCWLVCTYVYGAAAAALAELHLT